MRIAVVLVALLAGCGTPIAAFVKPTCAVARTIASVCALTEPPTDAP